MVYSISKDKMTSMNNPEKPNLFKMRRFGAVPSRIDTRRGPFSQANESADQNPQGTTNVLENDANLAQSQVVQNAEA